MCVCVCVCLCVCGTCTKVCAGGMVYGITSTELSKANYMFVLSSHMTVQRRAYVCIGFHQHKWCMETFNVCAFDVQLVLVTKIELCVRVCMHASEQMRLESGF